MAEQPVVSVLMITYNHERYIAQSIQNILNQKFQGPFELVIGEDFSTDSTREICEQYARDFPSRVRLLPTPHNLGMMPNFVRTLKACQGKYIAVCEGDDYWTDERKLQKQFEVLERNREVNLCFHLCREWNESEKRFVEVAGFKRDQYNFFDFAERGCFIHTCSVMFRNEGSSIGGHFGEWTYGLSGADYLLYLLATKGGHHAIALHDVMAVYRIHTGGSWSGLTQLKRIEMMDGDLDLYKQKLDLDRKETVYLNFQLKRINLGYLDYYLTRGNKAFGRFKRLIIFFFNRIYFIFGPGYLSSYLGLLWHPAIRSRAVNIKNRSQS